MHSVTHLPGPANLKPVSNLLVGQVGRTIDGRYLLRTYSNLVNLAAPGHTWSIPLPPLEVEILEPGTQITLTLGKDNC